MAEQQWSQNPAAQIRGKKDPFMNIDPNRNKSKADVRKKTSLSTLILWNISKALEKSPSMNLKDAIKEAQLRLEQERDMSAMIPNSAVQRHLACALLAWQQLGHSDTDSLCKFISNKKKTQECISLPSTDGTLDKVSMRSSQGSKYLKDVQCMNIGSSSIGPVVKLPVETKIVMRVENSPSGRHDCRKPKAPEKNTLNKIDAACCLDSACAERLAKLDTATTELRTRAGTLAKREAERVELLERAEAAWRDLEIGYQRRLTLAEEKEEDLARQIRKIIEERNGFKEACTTIATQLRENGENAEKNRAALSVVEKTVCQRACVRLKLSEESAQSEALLAEHQCRAAQMDRDLQFKEEQARRKLLNTQIELESSQTITHETERAMRAELSALREQIKQVSEQLLGADADNARIQNELEDMRKEKLGMIEDLEGCKVACDSTMQGKIDELKKKRDQLGQLKDKVMECRCKLPVDVTVEVKRTASLAALCQCSPEDKLLESCSCTSLRTSLLSNLLGDLFSGLQSEMGGTGTQMPCQLLKCLEDKHNWDRASVVKTNLKNYFSQLLLGELDIAIATSIEKYHAKWVGQSCADTARMIPDPGEEENEGWQERAIERRAQKLAGKLAEQLFQERADQLTQRAKEVVSSGPPPCECKSPTPKEPAKTASGNQATAVYPVQISRKAMSMLPVNGPTTPANTPAYWRQTMQDVTQLRMQIEDMKKDSLKKADLKLMEEKITKIVQRGSGTGKTDVRVESLDRSNDTNDITLKKEQKTSRAVNSIQSSLYVHLSKPTTLKKKQIETNSSKKGFKLHTPYNSLEKTFKPYKKLGQTYAVNMCMCAQQETNKIQTRPKRNEPIQKDKTSKDTVPTKTNSIKQTKPSRGSSIKTNSKSSAASGQQSCQSDCKCFHKIPSNTSIDKLLETLTKWKSDLKPGGTKQMKKEIGHEKANIVSSDIRLKGKIESVDQSKISSPSSAFVYGKSDSINNQNYAKTSSEGKKSNEGKKSILSKGGCCISNIKSNGVDSSPFAPTTTESEYMGAINLDKSNEDFCKCQKDNKNTSDQPNEAVQCMPCKCTCDVINNNNSGILVGSDQASNKPKYKSESQNNTTGFFPCDCSYDIQFLGVTLTDVTKDIICSGCDSGKNKNLTFDVDKKCNPIPKSKPNKNKKNLTCCGGLEQTSALKQTTNIENQEIKHDVCQKCQLFKNKASCESVPCCTRKEDLDEPNSCTDAIFHKQTSKDKPHEDKSFKESKDKKESCVCCQNLKSDECENLEQNTFLLLEEHIKEKLDEFKESSCNPTCIPPGEEEKLFATILNRVKQVIKESTNKITCNCIKHEESSQGSWNRAYSLLQEYLKTKIKRVQCSCDADINNKTIVPEVLGKVCNMIENDFERLKDVCGCNKSEIQGKDSKQELPVRDNIIFDIEHSVLDCCSYQNPQTISIVKENISSQVSAFLGMDTKSCNPLETYATATVQTVKYSQDNLKCIATTPLKQSTEFVSGYENKIKPAQFSNSSYVAYASECACTNNSAPVIKSNSTALETDVLKKPTCGKNSDSKVKSLSVIKPIKLEETDEGFPKQSEKTESSTKKLIYCGNAEKKTNAETVDAKKIKTSQLPEPQKNDCICNSTKNYEKNKNVKATGDQSEKIVSLPNKPYFGYTINCSCDDALGACVCTKSILQADNVVMDNIMKKSLPNDKYYEKISYIMKSNPTEKTNFYNDLLSEVTEDLYLPNVSKHKALYLDDLKQDGETEASLNDQEGIVLKNSREYFDIAHTTTNTFDDSVSLDTDYSNTEAPLDWCECCSQIPPRDRNSDQFKQAMYYPIPIKNDIQTDTKTDSSKNALDKTHINCDCDLVPICHVKMLVENIENKLVSAKCTCDSMLSKVCPIHSTRC